MGDPPGLAFDARGLPPRLPCPFFKVSSLPIVRPHQSPGRLVPAARQLDGCGGVQNPSLAALAHGSLGGGLGPGCLFGELAGPMRCTLAMLGQSPLQVRGLTDPAYDLRMRRLSLAGDRDEPLPKLAHRISTPLELGQIRDPTDVLGDSRAIDSASSRICCWRVRYSHAWVPARLMMTAGVMVLPEGPLLGARLEDGNGATFPDHEAPPWLRTSAVESTPIQVPSQRLGSNSRQSGMPPAD